MKLCWFIAILATYFTPIVLGGEYFSSNGTRYYFSPPMTKTWYQALRYCHAHGMYLVSIHTDEENVIILDLILNKVRPKLDTDHFWTSGTHLGFADKQFYWSESGFHAQFTNWITGYPSIAKHDCILLHGGHKYKWYDGNCNLVYYFICEDKMFVPNAVKREPHLVTDC